MKSIMVFRETGNLGDLMQAVALSRLIGPSTAFFRDQPHLDFPEYGLKIVAGFMLGPTRMPPESSLFAGIFWHAIKENVEWLKRSPFPVGARDPASHRSIVAYGVRSELVGCVSLTLPHYDGPRSGELSVDCSGPGVQMTHAVSKKLRFKDEWGLCIETLDQYKKAALVHTSRIHVAMPCIAMGTPVRYVGPTHEGRVSIIREIGLVPGEVCLPDVTSWKERYSDFLMKHAGVDAPRTAPVCPDVKEGA